MNNAVPYRSRPRTTAWGLVIAMLFAAELSMAQTIPLHLGTTTPIKDEYGSNLMGTMLADPSLCDRVEVLWATNGIFPPDINGNPDPRNALVEGGITAMGSLTDPGWTNPGLFAASIASPRPNPGAQLFVRVFNAPTREAASFYGDSTVFTVDSEYSYVYDVTISSMNPLDASDNDSDGLNNSWEESLRTDPDLTDTDGDGMTDGDEFRAGTDGTNPDDLLQLSDVQGKGPTRLEDDGEGGMHTMMVVEDAVVTWESKPGKRYRIEYTPDDLAYEPVFSNVTEVITATDTQSAVTVSGGLMHSRGTFRIRLIEE